MLILAPLKRQIAWESLERVGSENNNKPPNLIRHDLSVPAASTLGGLILHQERRGGRLIPGLPNGRLRRSTLNLNQNRKLSCPKR